MSSRRLVLFRTLIFFFLFFLTARFARHFLCLRSRRLCLSLQSFSLFVPPIPTSSPPCLARDLRDLTRKSMISGCRIVFSFHAPAHARTTTSLHPSLLRILSLSLSCSNPFCLCTLCTVCFECMIFFCCCSLTEKKTNQSVY